MSQLVNIKFEVGGRLFAWQMAYAEDDSCVNDMMSFLQKGKIPELEVVQIMTRAVRPGDRVVDGGANIGYFTLLLSKLVGSSGIVHAVEPSPLNLARLRCNIKLNELTNVEVCAAPLTECAERVWFYQNEHGGYDALYDMQDAPNAVRLSTITLDVCPGPLRLIKLDIEGAELRALRGAGRYLQGETRCPYIICEINNEILDFIKLDQQEIYDFMRRRGYGAYHLEPDKIPRLIPPGGVLQGGYANVLFTTDSGMRELAA